jgi:LmbE family N-acetylglucosaminyl deacetylase
MPLPLMENLRLLAVLAHPDDETFGIGGTLAWYARRGTAVHLVCATRGEVGEAPPGLKGFASVAEMRESELRCAAGVLGLAGIEFLGYRDSGMPGTPDNQHPQAFAAAPVDRVARDIARRIRVLRPQVVITFDPIGGYGHPDHIAAHCATVEGFRLAADPGKSIDGIPPFQPDKLYFQTFPRGALRFAVRLLRLFGQDPSHFGKNRDIDLAVIASVNYPIHARINIRSVQELKEKASACHSSQGGGPGTGPVRIFLRLFGGSEGFIRAYPLPPPKRIERDLFSKDDISARKKT